MKTIDRDFKNLRIPDQEMSFASGFMTALLLMVFILKVTRVIP